MRQRRAVHRRQQICLFLEANDRRGLHTSRAKSVIYGFPAVLVACRTSGGGSRETSVESRWTRTPVGWSSNRFTRATRESTRVSPSTMSDRPTRRPTSASLVRASLFIYRARQLYKNISMLFLFPVKDGKLSTGVNATFNASCYGQSSTIKNYLTKQLYE